MISPVSVGVWGLAKEDWRGVTYTLMATRLGVERKGWSTGTACNSHHSTPSSFTTHTLTTQTPHDSPLTPSPLTTPHSHHSTPSPFTTHTLTTHTLSLTTPHPHPHHSPLTPSPLPHPHDSPRNANSIGKNTTKQHPTYPCYHGNKEGRGQIEY